MRGGFSGKGVSGVAVEAPNFANKVQDDVHQVRCVMILVPAYLIPMVPIINTSYQKLPFGSGDYPDKLLYHQALNQVSNSSDRELPRDMFCFKTV